MSTQDDGAVQVGNPIIRKVLKRVSAEKLSSQEVADCIERMRTINASMDGVGISANQVGYDLRISLVHVKATSRRPGVKETNERIMINPEFVSMPPASTYMWEGCLSVAHAGIFVPVMRHKRVKVRYVTPEGQEVVAMLDGLEAHVAQHEIDHLDGIIFLDKDIDRQRFMSTDEYVAMRLEERRQKAKTTTA